MPTTRQPDPTGRGIAPMQHLEELFKALPDVIASLGRREWVHVGQ